MKLLPRMFSLLMLSCVAAYGISAPEATQAQGIIPVVTAVAGASATPITSGAVRTETADVTLDVGLMPTLTVRNTIGAITVTRSTDDTKVIFHATKRATTDEALRRKMLTITRDGDAITLSDENPSGGISVRNDSEFAMLPSADIEIALPREANLTVRNTRGSVSVVGIAGAVDASINTGTITINEGSGTATARVTDGQLTVQKFEGRLDLRATVGPITVRDFVGSATVRSTSGDITIAGTLTKDAPNQIQTTRGNITFVGALAMGSQVEVQATSSNIAFVLPPQSGFALSVNTNLGNPVVVDFPFVGTREEGERLVISGSVGNPTATLAIRQTSGAIKITPQT